MTMTASTSEVRQRIAAQYAALDSRSQVLLLVKLADRLTLMARDTYDQRSGVANGAKLRSFNEAQNRILAQLVRLLTADDRRYPDDVFANILVDQFETLNLDPGGITDLAVECSSEAKGSQRAARRLRTSKATGDSQQFVRRAGGE
jgi:hypothetical protein